MHCFLERCDYLDERVASLQADLEKAFVCFDHETVCHLNHGNFGLVILLRSGLGIPELHNKVDCK